MYMHVYMCVEVCECTESYMWRSERQPQVLVFAVDFEAGSLCHLILYISAKLAGSWALKDSAASASSLTVGLQMHACSMLDFKRIPRIWTKPSPSPNCFIFHVGLGFRMKTRLHPSLWDAGFPCPLVEDAGEGARETSRLPLQYHGSPSRSQEVLSRHQSLYLQI